MGAHLEPLVPSGEDGDWAVGDLILGPRVLAAAILTRADTIPEVRELLREPSAPIERLSPVRT